MAAFWYILVFTGIIFICFMLCWRIKYDYDDVLLFTVDIINKLYLVKTQ